jgi:hypothetical protein
LLKTLLITVAVIIAVTLFLFFRNRTRSTQQSSGKGQETYLGLRNQMLNGSRTKFSLPATSGPTEPWGVLMDWGVEPGTATVVAMSDGSASIYLSSGGGFLGGIAQEPIRNAAKAAVTLAEEVQPQMNVTSTFPLPETGQVRFYVLTDAGVYTATAGVADLQTGQSPFSKLGNAMQGVVTEYRIFQEKKESPHR